jgi:hypothetical protein
MAIKNMNLAPGVASPIDTNQSAKYSINLNSPHFSPEPFKSAGNNNGSGPNRPSFSVEQKIESKTEDEVSDGSVGSNDQFGQIDDYGHFKTDFLSGSTKNMHIDEINAFLKPILASSQDIATQMSIINNGSSVGSTKNIKDILGDIR